MMNKVREQFSNVGTVGSRIGNKSSNGAVFKMHTKNGSRKVLKMVEEQLGQREYNYQAKAAAAGLAPKVYKFVPSIELNPKRFANAFLMNNLQQNNTNTVLTMQQFIQSNKYSVQEKLNVLPILKSKIQKLHEIGIEHGDLHPGNIYVIISSNKKKFGIVIIDFGRSTKFDPNPSVFLGTNVSKHYKQYAPIYEDKNRTLRMPNLSKLYKIQQAMKAIIRGGTVRNTKLLTRTTKSPTRTAKSPTRTAKSPTLTAKLLTRTAKSPTRTKKLLTRIAKLLTRRRISPKF
jgi:tRNA A-37 threonylcarbamoyl transferase component Bud32